MSKDNIKPQKTEISQEDLSQGIANEFESISQTPIEIANLFENVKTVFYFAKINKDGEVVSADINHKDFIDSVNELGFFRYKIDKNFVLIRIINNIVHEVTSIDIQTVFMQYVKSLPFKLDCGNGIEVYRDSILNRLYAANGQFFSDSKLSLLPLIELDLNKDTKTSAFVYYQNGYVECNSEGYKLLNYSNLTKLIWNTQIIKRDFTYKPISSVEIALDLKVVYAEFMYLISKGDLSRMNSLCSIAGYLMHDFYGTDLKAPILTDSSISDVAEGRTGKGLFVKGIQQIRNLVDINGKDFETKERFKYQSLSMATQIVHLDDVKKDFKIESLFNDITSAITVEKKNVGVFSLNAKMVISSNKTIDIQGSSAKGRTIEFELSEYFNDEVRPSDVFGHYFFVDWVKQNEWSKFDNFMMFVIHFYLKNGLITPTVINLVNRKTLDNTSPEFYSWINEQEFATNIEYEKRELFNKFIEINPDLAKDKLMNTRRFTKWLKSWSSYNSIKFQERDSNGKYWIKFLNLPEKTFTDNN